MRLVFIPVLVAVVGLGAGASIMVHRTEPKSNSWYAAHPTEMQAKIARCNDHTGVATMDPDCITADDAKSDASFTKFHEMAEKLPWPGSK